MWQQTSIAAARRRWQAAITNGQESGQPPLLELGQSRTTLDQLWAVHALRQWQATRADVTAPEIVFGGEGPLWLYLFLISRAPSNAPQVFEPIFIFAGVERSIAMAGRASFVSPAYTATLAPAGGAGALAAGVAPFFAPAREPAQNAGWEALPFQMAPVWRLHATDQAPCRLTESSSVTEWTAWAAFGLAAALLLAPLFWG